MKKLIYSSFLPLLFIFCLNSCFLPEDYTAEVLVRKDGSCDFNYSGGLDYVPALAAQMEGSYTDKYEKDMEEIGVELRDESGFKSVEHLGKGHFKAVLNKKILPEEDYYFLSKDIKIFSFKHGEKGELSISGMTLEDDDIKTLRSLGSKLKGTLAIRVEKGIKVISHNADKKSKAGKNHTLYTWDLSIKKDAPEILLKK